MFSVLGGVKSEIMLSSRVVFAGESLWRAPLATSARISALSIVGELLRKVGVRTFTRLPTMLCCFNRSKRGFVAFQNLESKLASCRDYINQQAASRRSRGGGQGTPSGCGDSSESHPTNGLYNKG